MTQVTSALHERQCTFFIIYRWILLTVRSASDKICRENQNTYFMFNIFYRAVYEIM